MKAFNDLSTCRSTSMSIGPIPWTAIIEYANWYGLEKDVTEAFIDIIREMDAIYINSDLHKSKASS